MPPLSIPTEFNPTTLAVVGLNSVGMERGGIDQEIISILKKAYKIVYRQELNLKEAIKKIEALNSEEIKEVQNFVSSLKSSERGILR